MKITLSILLLLANCATAQINLNQGLIIYHPFSGNATDAGTNGINGTVINATLTSDRNGIPNSAYYFDGSTAYIELPYNNLYNFSAQGAFSISVWVLPDQNNSWPAQAVVVKSPFHSDFTLSQWNYGTYILNYKAMSGYANNHILNGTTLFTINQCWYNITSTYNNGVWNLYVNGKLESTNTAQTNFILQDGFSKIVFGKKGEAFGDFYKGKMDEVRIYDRVFTQDEIDSLAFNSQSTKAIEDASICPGGSFQLNASGAANYSWTPTSGLSIPTIANPIASPQITTKYYVTGLTSSGCATTDSVVLTVNPIPVVTKSNDTLICSNTSVQLFANGGAQYAWMPSASLNNPNIPNPLASPANNTKYYVTVTNLQGCSKIDSVQVSLRSQNSFSVNPDEEICPLNSIQLSASGGDRYSWSPATSLDNPNIANPFASPLVTTMYSVLITDTVCNNSTILNTSVSVSDLPTITATSSNDIDCSSNQSQLNATGGTQYNWLPAASLNNANIPNPVATPLTTTQYYVTGTDASGCTNIDSVVVNVSASGKSNYLMPNAFTPTNDGLNDCYGIKYWGAILELDLKIYNRWGQLVFQTTDPTKCWDGNFKNKPQNTGVFVYWVKAKTSCENYVFRKGIILLIR